MLPPIKNKTFVRGEIITAKIKLLYGGEIITVRCQKLTTVTIKRIFYNSYEDVCVN